MAVKCEDTLKKKSPKKNFFKYFQPIDVGNIINSDNDTLNNIDDSLGYFAFANKKKKLFLNRFSQDEMLNISSEVGLVAHLNSKGYNNIMVEIDRDESLIHYFKMYFDEIDPKNLIIDLRVSESRFVPHDGLFKSYRDSPTLDMIVIEWLSSQNPKNDFTDTKPQLPGQKKPGLGCLSFMMEMMYIVGKEVIKDGFMDIPDHMHGAIMYSKKFKFFDPAHEAILKAIIRDLSDYSLLDISWGMITGTIIEKHTGKPQDYDPAEQIFPVSSRIKKYFSSRDYEKKFKDVYNRKKYIFDYEKMKILRGDILKSKDIVDL
jgi:hypothetical protein